MSSCEHMLHSCELQSLKTQRRCVIINHYGDGNSFISSDNTSARFLKLKITKKRKKVQNKCTLNVPLSTEIEVITKNKCTVIYFWKCFVS